MQKNHFWVKLSAFITATIKVEREKKSIYIYFNFLFSQIVA